MRPWRDILSKKTFDLVARNAPQRHARLEQCVQQISAAIGAYHQVEKSSYIHLGMRIGMLQQLSKLAGQYNSNQHRERHQAYDLAQASLRQPVRPGAGPQFWMDDAYNSTGVPRHHKDPFNNSFMRGQAKDESLDRNILTLERRALRKANYLKMLSDMYRDSTSRMPDVLIRELNAPQEVTMQTVGIVNGVRMEKLDPAHRPVELARNAAGDLIDANKGPADPTSMNTMLLQWIHESTTRPALPPFFLWLEDKVVCLSENKSEIAHVASVAYVTDPKNAPAHAKLRMVLLTGQRIMMTDLSQPQNTVVPCSTADYMSAKGKGGLGTAAYVWTLNDELLIGQHQQSSFHHSSFKAGGEVKCAGMIRIDNHRIQLVTNNSGHYRPSAVHLRNFISFLQRHNAIDGTAHVHCAGFERYTGDVAGFMAPRALPIGPRTRPRVGTHRMPPRVGTHRM